MKHKLKMALGVLAFGTIALAAMPTGRAFAQTSDAQLKCTNQLRNECIDEVAQDTKCCIDPKADGCDLRAFDTEEVAPAPATETPAECVLTGLHDLVGCANCDFPEGIITAK